MSLLDTYSDSLGLAATSTVALPKPAPQPRLSLWGLTTAAPKGVAAAGAERAGFASDVLGAFGQVLGAYPEAMGASVTGEQRKQADEARQKLLTEGMDFSSEAGDLFRGVAREYRPDAKTASTAENLLFGLSRGLSKIAADVVTMGPAGAAVSAADEASMVADDLKREGVPLGARTAAGTVQGAFMGLGAILPMAGQTLKATAALYLAGGPAGFVAQQAITRHILENAGQDKAAAQFDPFDPVGLAVASIIPLPFAHYGLKANRAAQAEAFRTGPVPSEPTPLANRIAEAYAPEHVDAARVLQLVEQRRSTHVGDPADLPAMARHEAALAKAEEQIAAGERVSVADEAPFITTEQRAANFKEWSKDAPLIPAMSGHEFKTGSPVVVDAFHGTTREFDAFSNSTLGEKTGGADAKAGHFLSDNPNAADQFTWENGNKSGHIMPAYVRLLNPFVSDHVLNGATGTAAGKIIAEAKAAGHDGVIFPRSDMLGSKGATFVAFDPKQIKSAIGNSGKYDPNSASLTDPLPAFASAVDQLRAARSPEPAPPAKPTRGRTYPTDAIELRKQQSVLTRLLECLNE